MQLDLGDCSFELQCTCMCSEEFPAVFFHNKVVTRTSGFYQTCLLLTVLIQGSFLQQPVRCAILRLKKVFHYSRNVSATL